MTAAALRSSAAHVFVADLDAPELADGDVHHLTRVLRIRAGDTITVSDGRGSWAPAQLRGEQVVITGAVVGAAPRPDAAVWSAIPKGDRPEWMTQKLTELGIGTIGWLHCSRSVVRWDDERWVRQLDRLRRVAREAAMQSRRLWLPVIEAPRPLAAVGAVLAEPGAPRLTADVRTVAIGPEGGWSPEELGAATSTASLGDSILRVETAALVAAVLITRAD